MAPRIFNYFLCGMRHPNSGLDEDDLSRLTGSSLSPESCSSNGCSDNGNSSSSSPSTPSSPSSTLSHNEQQQQTKCNGALVATATTRNKDSPLLTATTNTSATVTSSCSALDAELLKNLKNTSHAHAHIHPNATATANVNGNEHSTKHSNNTAGSHFNSSYLPEFIDPLDWQKSRKRKERFDSASSATQDRKLIRSNSEELLTNEDECHLQVAARNEFTSSSLSAATANVALKLRQHVDAIRRVASEDYFPRTPPYCYDLHLEATSADAEVPTDPIVKGNDASDEGDENDASVANRQQHELLASATSSEPLSGPSTKEMTRKTRLETSPSRSHRHSPNRSIASKYLHRDSDDSECEHERRRSSERFCKSRAPPGRKAAGIVKKSGKMLGSTKVHGDENSYKYDISALKYERRGFVSKKLNTANGADYNDNNLIDFHIIRSGGEAAAVSCTTAPAAAVGAVVEPQKAASPQSSRKSVANNSGSIINATSAEALPWESSTASDQTEPMLSRRYATARHHLSDCIDTAAKLSKVMPYPQQFHKQAPGQLLADDLAPLDTYRAFTSLENLKTREVMQQVIPAMMSFQSPEERLKQLNKRLTSLKKKLVQFEEAFEMRAGYRPSHAEKLNDKYMKNVLSELSKLRKEKQHLKSDPMAALGLKVPGGGMDAAQKLEKMKATLNEIKQNLSEKRKDANRSEVLDDLTAEQLLHEKSAVQHVLLSFESLYGRPSTKEERDEARPLYDRYRQLKRLVSRSVALSGSVAAGASELPTILEHEAMVFESTLQQQQQPYSANENTDSSNNSPTNTTASVEESSTNSTTTTTTTASQPLCGENISSLSIDQLWEQLDKTREEKQLLKSTIREYETAFEEQNGRKMLKHDRKIIEETYAQYKEKKAKTRLLQALIKKQISR